MVGDNASSLLARPLAVMCLAVATFMNWCTLWQLGARQGECVGDSASSLSAQPRAVMCLAVGVVWQLGAGQCVGLLLTCACSCCAQQP